MNHSCINFPIWNEYKQQGNDYDCVMERNVKKIMDSIQETIKLIEDVKKDDQTAYVEHRMKLDHLLVHMQTVVSNLEK